MVLQPREGRGYHERMDVTPRELRDIDIREAFRGYNRDEVDDLLERAAATIERHLERVRELGDRLSSVEQEAGGHRETEDMLHRTLLLAQRTADEAVAEARARAQQMVDEAEARARSLLSEAETSARRVAEAERTRREQDVAELAQTRDRLQSDVDALETFALDYRDRLFRLIEADLAAIAARPSAALPERPATSDVEVPVAPEGVEWPPEAVPAEAEVQPMPPVPAVPPASSESRVPAETTEIGTAADDVSWQAPPPGAVAPEAIVLDDVAEPTASLFAEPDPMEAEVLDDDAFFATLREAVHDDTPLGPRDDDEEPIYDQDLTDPGRFGVFKRRR